MMTITITKSCLEVLNNLSDSFTNAIYKPTEKLSLDRAQFTLINNTGLNIEVHLKDSDFVVSLIRLLFYNFLTFSEIFLKNK